MLACGASALVHAWLAWQVPAGMAPAGGATAALDIRLVPSAQVTLPAPAADVSVDETSRDVARETPARDRTRAPNRVRAAAAGPGERGGVTAHNDATYYPAQQLDVYPALLHSLDPAYPESAAAQSIIGRVLAQVRLDAAGRVDDVDILEAEPAGYFEIAARGALHAARFSAARRNGLPVRSLLLIQLHFDPARAGTAAR